jgi:hypothetical protein
MKVDFSTTLRDLRGKVIQNVVEHGDPASGKPPVTEDTTLATVAAEALLYYDPRGTQDPGIKKAQCAHLALRVHKGGVLDVTAEDIVLLKDKIGAIYAPLVVARAYELLENTAG